MKRVLITGATGFVGASLARRLLTDGHEVHVLARPGHSRWRLADVASEMRWHEGAIEDLTLVGAAVDRARPDWVFHLAVYGAYPEQRDLARMIATNVVGTANLLGACLQAGVEAFVNTGSSSEYGFKAGAPSEDAPLEPNSDYAWSKASATLYTRQAAQRQGAPVTTLRLYSVYGPWEEPRRLMPTLIVCGRRGELPPLVGADVARDFVYVDDVVEAYLLAAGSRSEPGALYNVGSGVQTCLREIVALARRTLGVSRRPIWRSMPERAWDTSTWIADNRLIRERLGWRPRTALGEGFRRFVAWMEAEPGRLEFYEERRGAA